MCPVHIAVSLIVWCASQTMVQLSNLDIDLPEGYVWYETMIVLRPDLTEEDRCAEVFIMPCALTSVFPSGACSDADILGSYRQPTPDKRCDDVTVARAAGMWSSQSLKHS